MYAGRYTGVGHAWTKADSEGKMDDPIIFTDPYAYAHDVGYQQITDSGRDPYFHWNEADHTMMKDLASSHPRTISGRFTKDVVMRGLSLKRFAAPEDPFLKTKRSKSLPSNIVDMSAPEQPLQSNAMPRIRRRRKRSTRRKRMTKKSLTKKIRRAIATPQWTKPWTQRVVESHNITSAVNQVAWNTFDRALSRISSIKVLLTDDGGPTYYNQDILGTNYLSQPDLTVVSPAGLLNLTGAKFKISRNYNVSMRNNTNFPAHMTVYVFKCTDYTQRTPFDDLNLVYQSQIKDSVSQDVTLDPFQYFTVTGASQQSRQWKIHSKQQYYLDGGKGAAFNIKIPPFVYNPDLISKFAIPDVDYAKGSFYVMFRTTGVPAHDASVASSVGWGNCSLDLVVRQFTMTQAQRNRQARTNTMDPTTIESIVPIIGDEELVGVGPFDNA